MTVAADIGQYFILLENQQVALEKQNRWAFGKKIGKRVGFSLYPPLSWKYKA